MKFSSKPSEIKTQNINVTPFHRDIPGMNKVHTVELKKVAAEKTKKQEKKKPFQLKTQNITVTPFHRDIPGMNKVYTVDPEKIAAEKAKKKAQAKAEAKKQAEAQKKKKQFEKWAKSNSTQPKAPAPKSTKSSTSKDQNPPKIPGSWFS